ncbi:inositol 2-dehydrogenase [Candidatus Nanopelagicales bacterium]|nr:inositol 2-dehydrogenase [Candidatus Nanopelagicales bacterium]
MTVRIGVLGVGRIGRMHAEIIANEIEGAAVAGVFDVNEAAAAAVADELRVPVMTVEEMLASPDVDAVAVCSSTDTHVELIERAAAAGKAIFCEKPVSLDLAEVDKALAAVEKFQVPFMVGFNRRFDPTHAAVQEAVASGRVGEPHIARLSSRDPAPPPVEYIKVSGGIFVDMMIHDFDMARFVVGSPVTKVYATGAVRIDPAIGEAGDLDTAVVTLTHENGCITVIDNSRQAVYGYDQRMEVLGSTGMAMSENPMKNSAMVYTSTERQGSVLPYFFLDRYTDSYRIEWEAFVRYIRDGGPSPVSGADGRAPVAIGIAAWDSYHSGVPVTVDQG